MRRDRPDYHGRVEYNIMRETSFAPLKGAHSGQKK